MALDCHWYVGRGVISGILGVFYIVVLVAICSNQSKLDAPYYKLIISLGISDLLAIVYNILRGCVTCVDPILKYYVYILSEATDIINMLHMIVICTVRFMSTFYTLDVSAVFNPFRIKVLIFLMWIAGILWGIFFTAVYIIWPLSIGKPVAFNISIYTYADVTVVVVCVTISTVLCAVTGIRLAAYRKNFSKLGIAKQRYEIRLFVQLCSMCFFLLYEKAAWTIGNYNLQVNWGWAGTVFIDMGSSVFYVMFVAFNPVLYVIFDVEIYKVTKNMFKGKSPRQVHPSQLDNQSAVTTSGKSCLLWNVAKRSKP